MKIIDLEKQVVFPNNIIKVKLDLVRDLLLSSTEKRQLAAHFSQAENVESSQI